MSASVMRAQAFACPMRACVCVFDESSLCIGISSNESMAFSFFFSLSLSTLLLHSLSPFPPLSHSLLFCTDACFARHRALRRLVCRFTASLTRKSIQTLIKQEIVSLTCLALTQKYYERTIIAAATMDIRLYSESF